ncbi:hypothetical protein NPIL_170231 [Nephila pilipes]|uniref:Uncharacterized protein n=1 Tax=Nephila pilipes TaxID=299642 RepID=A0A8X6R302_NEPPI|nr:hypothetical protein NPIL_170231 [Nephila pilipes]
MNKADSYSYRHQSAELKVEHIRFYPAERVVTPYSSSARAGPKSMNGNEKSEERKGVAHHHHMIERFVLNSSSKRQSADCGGCT